MAASLHAEAIAGARRAANPVSAMAESAPGLLARRCTVVEPGYQVSPRVRNLIAADAERAKQRECYDGLPRPNRPPAGADERLVSEDLT